MDYNKIGSKRDGIFLDSITLQGKTLLEWLSSSGKVCIFPYHPRYSWDDNQKEIDDTKAQIAHTIAKESW